MGAFAEAVAALHADPDLSVAATYTPPGEDAEAVACRVILSERDSADGMMIARETTITILLAEIAAPAEGATITVGATTWRASAWERDVEGVTATAVVRG